MTDLSKYPLVGKILSEQNDLFQFLINDKTPAELVAIQTRVADIIDRNVDRSDSEKEALIVGAVLALAPPPLLDDPNRFAVEYSAEVKAVIDDMISARGRAVAPTNLAQLGTAINIVVMEDLAKGLRDGSLEQGRLEIKAAFDNAGEAEKLIFPNLAAPKLQAAYEAAKSDIGAALGAPASDNDNKPAAPKKKNNGGGNFDLG